MSQRRNSIPHVFIFLLLAAFQISSMLPCMPGLLAASAQVPTLETVRSAMEGEFKRRGTVPPNPIEIRSVEGCYPAVGKISEARLCLVEARGADGEFGTQPLLFHFQKNNWKLFAEDVPPDPSCPGKAIAQALFQEVLHNKALTITEVPEEGTFSDERGIDRSQKGPLRLMCTYGGKNSLGELTLIGYFRYSDAHYSLDSDVETWGE